MLDYRTFPTVAYHKASYDVLNSSGTKIGTKAYPRDKNDDPYYWEVKDASGVVHQMYDDAQAKKLKAVKKVML
jgi:hypothetical protein